MRAAAILLLAALPALGAEFRMERPLTPEGPGPAWAEVDAELLAGAAPLAGEGAAVSGLQDLRLVAADGREVPYLVVAPAVPAAPRLELRWVRRPSEPGTSRFRLALPGPHLPLAALALDVEAGHLLRQARVTEARLGDGEVVPVPLGEATLRRVDLEGAWYEELTIPLRRPASAELELVVEDGDNPPLALAKVFAVFAPLPWLYFESRDGAPLVARFGAAGLEAPRYDLEALRGRVQREGARQASWGQAMRAAITPPKSAVPVELSGALLETAGFRYRRTVAAKEPGLTALALDAAILAHSRELRDLRLVDAEGRQVPYLLERRDEPLVTTLKLERDRAREDEPGFTQYRVSLPFAGLPASRLVLETRARVFRRELKVFAVSNEGRAGEPRAIASSSWHHADPDTPAPSLSIHLPALSGTELRIAVADGENSPLPLEAPRLLVPSHRLRFFGGRDLTLLYGHPQLSAPRYDLELLAPKLVGAAVIEVEAGAEERAGTDPEGRSRFVFWGVLIAAVVLLLGLLARLLTGKHEG